MDTQLPDEPASHPFPINRIVQHVLNTSRLTFEDETQIRHTLTVLKRRSRWKPPGGPGFPAVVLAGSGAIMRFGISRYFPESGKKLEPLMSRAIFGAGVYGIIAAASNRLVQETLIANVRSLMDLIQETGGLSKNILRWLQDNEVVQRGYMVATADIPENGKVLSSRACVRLRRATFLESRFAVFVLRAAAVDLLQKVTEDDPLDITENHICIIPVEEFGDSFHVPENEVEALYVATDGFSLQALKSLLGLLDLQTSEFLKLLCTFVIQGRSFPQHLNLLRQLRKVHKLLLEAHNRLESEYRFETQQPAEPKERRRHSKPGFAPPDYLRSLELHLTAALKDVRDISGHDLEEGELERVVQQDKMEKLGYHVKCSSMLMDHLKRRNITEEHSSSFTEPSPTKSDFELQEVVRSDDKIHVDDEIFEALVLGDAAGDNRGEPVLSELNQYLEQKQQTKMILEEIKSLLQVRSSDWKERERKVRERKGLPLDNGDDEPASAPKDIASLNETTVADDISDEYTAAFSESSELASMAAAMSAKWRIKTDEQYGSDQSEGDGDQV